MKCEVCKTCKVCDCKNEINVNLSEDAIKDKEYLNVIFKYKIRSCRSLNLEWKEILYNFIDKVDCLFLDYDKEKFDNIVLFAENIILENRKKQPWKTATNRYLYIEEILKEIICDYDHLIRRHILRNIFYI